MEVGKPEEGTSVSTSNAVYTSYAAMLYAAARTTQVSGAYAAVLQANAASTAVYGVYAAAMVPAYERNPRRVITIN